MNFHFNSFPTCYQRLEPNTVLISSKCGDREHNWAGSTEASNARTGASSGLPAATLGSNSFKSYPPVTIASPDILRHHQAHLTQCAHLTPYWPTQAVDCNTSHCPPNQPSSFCLHQPSLSQTSTKQVHVASVPNSYLPGLTPLGFPPRPTLTHLRPQQQLSHSANETYESLIHLHPSLLHFHCSSLPTAPVHESEHILPVLTNSAGNLTSLPTNDSSLRFAYQPSPEPFVVLDQAIYDGKGAFGQPSATTAEEDEVSSVSQSASQVVRVASPSLSPSLGLAKNEAEETWPVIIPRRRSKQDSGNWIVTEAALIQQEVDTERTSSEEVDTERTSSEEDEESLASSLAEQPSVATSSGGSQSASSLPAHSLLHGLINTAPPTLFHEPSIETDLGGLETDKGAR
ncbi:unnamed protein product [Protopolystoma xenopodis]|uniref:Uncharacterized protein n=1 Tax=Protopolystoma xenopodis TaxID=117903 RepID=A0A3S5BNZ4_9PLAT|nr:unnamed protein product [Protopolystoma xenopodis]